MKKGKIKHILLLTTPLALVAVIAFTIAHFTFMPLDSQITTYGLMSATEETDYILVKANDEYFEIQGTTEFAALFEFSLWQQQKKEPSSGEPVLILRFAEAWIVEFFPDGMAMAHNGYASRCTKPDVCYAIPPNTADALISYIETYGVKREYGDGTIGDTTFHK